jgi:RNA polymerase sigma factor (TIGR02999 family)
MKVQTGVVTRLLSDIRAGRDGAVDRLASVVYTELRKLAAARMRSERGEHTLSPTALANEAWARFGPELPAKEIESRRHFFGIAVNAMRQILIDHARARLTAKRGSGAELVPLDAVDVAVPHDDQLVALDDALKRLASVRPRAARVVELRFFGGFSHGDIAALLDLERRTVDRDWAFAKAWIAAELGRAAP